MSRPVRFPRTFSTFSSRDKLVPDRGKKTGQRGKSAENVGESITRLHTGASRRRRLLFHLLEIRATEHSALLFTRRRACIKKKKKKEMEQIAWRTSRNDTPDDENGGALNVNTHQSRDYRAPSPYEAFIYKFQWIAFDIPGVPSLSYHSYIIGGVERIH